jgi:RND family efflux transporter MFP subunit
MKRNNIIFFAAIICMTQCKTSGRDKIKDDPKPAAPEYTLAAVKSSGIATMVKLPGQLAAYQEVKIYPKVNGYVKYVYVDIGSKVTHGQLLMRLEAPELEQGTLQAKEKYVRTKADLSIDKEHYNRLLEASMTPGAVSPLEISSAKAKVESDSALSNAAKTNWEMEQTMQSYLQVIAPFNGVITERNVHPGALVSVEEKDATPMLELKEVARLRLQVDIPENLAGNLKEGESIDFFTSASPGKKMTGLINRKSMNINPHFRVERVEADVMNNHAELAPGMYADVIIYPKGNETAYSVPKSSVVVSTERKYVLVVKSNRISKVDVNTGNESGDYVEVYGNFEKGDHVIVNANDEIKEGDYAIGN